MKTSEEFLKEWALDAISFNAGIRHAKWTRDQLEGLAKYIGTPTDKPGPTGVAGVVGAVLRQSINWDLAGEVRKALEWAGIQRQATARWVGQHDTLEEVFHAAKAAGRAKRAEVYRKGGNP